MFAGQGESNFERQGDAGAYRHILGVHRKAGRGDRHLVLVRRNIEEVERAGSVGDGGALVARQRIVEFDLGARNDSSGGVTYLTIDCACGAGRLRSGGECECEIDEPRTHGDGFREHGWLLVSPSLRLE